MAALIESVNRDRQPFGGKCLPFGVPPRLTLASSSAALLFHMIPRRMRP
jgi:hypothetical protein